MAGRCDGIADCNDAFDEKSCTMIYFEPDLYRKEYPPLDKESGHTGVDIDLADIHVSAVDEFVQIFHVKFFIQLTW